MGDQQWREMCERGDFGHNVVRQTMETIARWIAEKIWDDLNGRAGCDLDIEEDIVQEILSAWEKIADDGIKKVGK